jgi:hypothetical protein
VVKFVERRLPGVIWALARTARSAVHASGQASWNRRALTAYLTTFHAELATVVHDLQGLRSRVTDTSTVNLVIKLDDETERLPHHALSDLDAMHSAHLTRQEFSRLFGPFEHSEESAAVRLSTSTFPTACLGEA